jgi:hypothetical protein
MVENLESQFIISGEYGKLLKLPTAKVGKNESQKRPRGFTTNQQQDATSIVSMKKKGSGDDEYRLFRYKDLSDLQTRALVAKGVLKLWAGGSIDKPLDELFLSVEEDPARTIQVLIREIVAN